MQYDVGLRRRSSATSFAHRRPYFRVAPETPSRKSTEMMVLGVLVASWCARGLAAFAPAAPASARGAPLAAQVRKVGIVGGGTVGGGIVEILERRREQLVAATGGVGLEVKAVVVRDAAKARDWTAPRRTMGRTPTTTSTPSTTRARRTHRAAPRARRWTARLALANAGALRRPNFGFV